jgi:hypothetical protein
MRSMPIEKSAAPRSRPCVLRVRPDNSSFPMEMSSAFGFIWLLSVCVLFFLIVSWYVDTGAEDQCEVSLREGVDFLG